MTCHWRCECRGLSARWPGGTEFVLNNLDLSISFESSLMWPLMGETGEGKSTLLYLLAAQKWPDKGEVVWTVGDGQTYRWGEKNRLDGDRIAKLRSEVFGFAFQDSTLFPDLSVKENLMSSVRIKQPDISKAELHDLIEEILLGVLDKEKEPLDKMLDRFPRTLSGGQRQRIALAQAMVKQPWILFADEPTGSLDYKTRHQVMLTLKNWAMENKRCIIWVTHHDKDDLDIMGVDKLLWVEGKTCQEKSISFIKKWRDKVNKGDRT